MDGERFDQIARSVATATTRRGLLKGLAGGALAAAFGLGRGRTAEATHKPPGAACRGTVECSQTTALGRGFVCADNGIAADGALNCCHNEGQSCGIGAHCCGNLLCVQGQGEGLGAGTCRVPGSDTYRSLGQTCTATSQCSQAGGAVVCADNGIAADGATNCCRGAGGACSRGAHCCGDLLCADNGIAGDGALNCCRNEGGFCTTGAGCCGGLECVNNVCTAFTGARALGVSCTAAYQCSQAGGATTCAANGFSSDGALNCCRNQGGACASSRHCCGSLVCSGGVCSGVTTANRAPGQSCTATSQCSQAGGAVVCADNGLAGDGPLNCCRNEGGVCTSGAGCCGDLICADNGYGSDGALNCCRNAGGRCASPAACCGALACVNGYCQ